MSTILKLENDFLKLGVSTKGAELMYIYSQKGTQFLWEGSEKSWNDRAPILFPICSRLRNNQYTHKGKTYDMGMHGFAMFKEFKGEKISDNVLKFTLVADEETRVCYPFDFELNIYYELLENKLNVRYEVKNPAESELFFSIGAHEGYYCPEGIEEYYIEFDNVRNLDRTITENGVTTSKTERMMTNSKIFPLKNDYFVGKSIILKNTDIDRMALVHKNSSKRITVDFKGFPWFLLWTIPGEQYICLEPWHGICDMEGSNFEISEKGSIITLKGHEAFETVHTITFEE